MEKERGYYAQTQTVIAESPASMEQKPIFYAATAIKSQHESHLDRQISKAHTIRTKLGGEAGLLTPFPDRPKGMHRKSYQKLYQQAMYGETCFLKNVKI